MDEIERQRELHHKIAELGSAYVDFSFLKNQLLAAEIFYSQNPTADRKRLLDSTAAQVKEVGDRIQTLRTEIKASEYGKDLP
jgi:hypothetical protein